MQATCKNPVAWRCAKTKHRGVGQLPFVPLAVLAAQPTLVAAVWPHQCSMPQWLHWMKWSGCASLAQQMWLLPLCHLDWTLYPVCLQWYGCMQSHTCQRCTCQACCMQGFSAKYACLSQVSEASAWRWYCIKVFEGWCTGCRDNKRRRNRVIRMDDAC